MRQSLAKAAGLTNVGLKRESNEDFFSFDDTLGLYIVADGMGGHLAGNIASRTAVDLINKSFQKFIQSETEEEALFGYPDHSISRTGNCILSSIRLANRVIYEMATHDDKYHGMGTTVAVLVVMGGLVISANVGDSRIYMVRNGQIERLSKDHTVVAEQLEMGILTNEDAENSPMKHVLTRNLGFTENIDIEIIENESTNNERFILCTDGLTDLILDDEILHMVSKEDNPKVVCRNLIDQALKRGGHDNTTVVSIYLSETDKPYLETVRKIGNFLAEILQIRK